MNANEITSVGCLDNQDGSIALTICLRYKVHPVYVTVSKDELEKLGGIAGLNQRKSDAADLYIKYGAGRQGNI
nr:hypothetical protein [Pseudomonas aeruginosa]